tara:strand:+ start:1080 stop:1331 length:252 start_codon:yes stop_codon:yes gene_type:complete
MANAAPVAEASGQGEKGKGKGRQNQNKKKEVGASEKPAVEASKAPLQDAEATLKQNNNVQKSAAEVVCFDLRPQFSVQFNSRP